MTTNRRRDRLGVHSIGEFLMTVPSLEDARRFYSTFGLDVRDEDGGLALRTHGNPHVWGRLQRGERKKFEALTFHCFADELDAFKRHIEAQGVALLPPPNGASAEGLWLQSPDGVLLQVRAGPKTTPD